MHSAGKNYWGEQRKADVVQAEALATLFSDPKTAGRAGLGGFRVGVDVRGWCLCSACLNDEPPQVFVCWFLCFMCLNAFLFFGFYAFFLVFFFCISFSHLQVYFSFSSPHPSAPGHNQDCHPEFFLRPYLFCRSHSKPPVVSVVPNAAQI